MSLPGVTTLIKDRFYNLSRTDIPRGPKILVLGTRTTASGTGGIQDLDPYNASDEATVISVFGNGSQLHRGFLECLSGGAQRVLMVALPSDTVFNHTNATISSAHYTTSNPTGNLFDDAFSAVEAAQPDIVVPWGRGSGPNDWEIPATPGDDVELGFHADNSSSATNSWAKKISDKVATITNESYPCFAVLGVRPFGVGALTGATPSFSSSFTTDGGMTPADVNSHLQLTNLASRADPNITNGIYLSIVAAEIESIGYNNNNDFGFSNGACIYAGHVSQLDSYSAPTGKPVFNIKSIRYSPTRTQQTNLVAKGVVPVTLNFNTTPTWVDGQTFGALTSDYVRLTTLRIVFEAVQLVRQVAARFIGEGASIEHKHALDTAITAGLRGMQQLGALLASDFAITYVPAENRADVDLVLTPAFELRTIVVSVSVNLG